MYTGFLYLHSVLRYIIVILMLVAIVRGFMGWFGKKPFTSTDNKTGLFLMISSHIQLLVGIILYMISPIVQHGLMNMAEAMHDKLLRYWTVEHATAMIIGIAFITIGRIWSKKGKTDAAKHRISAIMYTLAFLIIFFSIPWPWKEIIARPWI